MIWTIQHNNVFILNTTENELAESGGLIFTIMNYNRVVKSEEVASVRVSTEDILGATPSKRMEYKLRLAATDRATPFKMKKYGNGVSSRRKLLAVGRSNSFFELGRRVIDVSSRTCKYLREHCYHVLLLTMFHDANVHGSNIFIADAYTLWARFLFLREPIFFINSFIHPYALAIL